MHMKTHTHCTRPIIITPILSTIENQLLALAHSFKGVRQSILTGRIYQTKRAHITAAKKKSKGIQGQTGAGVGPNDMLPGVTSF